MQIGSQRTSEVGVLTVDTAPLGDFTRSYGEAIFNLESSCWRVRACVCSCDSTYTFFRGRMAQVGHHSDDSALLEICVLRSKEQMNRAPLSAAARPVFKKHFGGFKRVG